MSSERNVPRATIGHAHRPSTLPLLPTSQQDSAVVTGQKSNYFRTLIERNTGFLLCACSSICLCFINISVAVFYSVAKNDTVSTSEVIFARMSLTGICCIIYMFYAGTEHPLLGPPGIRGLLVLRGVTGFFGLSSVYYSLGYLSIGDVTSMTFLAPVLTGLAASLLLSEPYRPLEAMAALSSILGVIFIAKPSSLFSPEKDAAPVLHDGRPVTEAERLRAVCISLLGVVGATGAYLMIRKIGTRASPMHSITYFSYYCCIVSVLLMIIFPSERPSMPSDWSFVLLLLAIGLLGFLAQAFLTMGLQRENAGRATLATYCQLPLALFMEYVIFKRWPDMFSALGAAIICFSTMTVVLTKKAPQPVESKDGSVPVGVEGHAASDQVELSPSTRTSVYSLLKGEDEEESEGEH